MRERSERASTHTEETLGHLWAILLHSRASRSHARTGFRFLSFWRAESGAPVEAKRSLSHFGRDLGVSWAILGLSWAILGHLGPSWGYLGPSLGHLGPSWGHLGPTWGQLGAILGYLGPSWGRLGAILGPSWAILGYPGASWVILGVSWAILGASWAILGRTCGQFGVILGSLWGGLPSKSVVLVEVKRSFSHLWVIIGNLRLPWDILAHLAKLK